MEGSSPLYAPLDVITCITGQESRDASKTLKEARRLGEREADNIRLTRLRDSPGRLNRSRSPIADVKTILHIIINLPCRGLGPLKAQLRDVFCRFMGGDLSLIPELQANHAHQQAPSQEGSDAPDAAFGEYVRATRPPPPQDVWRTPPSYINACSWRVKGSASQVHSLSRPKFEQNYHAQALSHKQGSITR